MLFYKLCNVFLKEIQRQYKTHFGKDLIEDVKSETSGNFERLLVGLLRPIVDFYCAELNDAMSGIGTDEDVLIEILCTLSNNEIHTIKNQYLRCKNSQLVTRIEYFHKVNVSFSVRSSFGIRTQVGDLGQF